MHDGLNGGGQPTSTPLGWRGVADALPLATGIAVGLEYVWANAAFCELAGLPLQEVIGRDVRAFLAEPLRAGFRDIAAGVRRGERSFHLEGELARPDGAFRRAAIDIALVSTVEGGSSTALVQATDLTDLHQARGRLAASERMHRSMLANVSDTITLARADGRVLNTTGRQPQALGYETSRWERANPFDLVHPDDLPRALTAWQEVLTLPGRRIDEEVRMTLADGTLADVELTAVNLLDDPDVGAVVVTHRDITRIRRAERLSSSQARVLELIARRAPLDEIFDRCLRLAEDNGVTGRSSIYLLDGERLVFRAGWAPKALNDFMLDPPRDPPRCLCDHALATGAWVELVDIDDDDDDDDGATSIPAGLRAVCQAEGLRAGWSVPISHGSGGAVGTLSTIFDAPHRPESHERHVGEVVANLVAVAIEREADADRLAHQAMHDALTGLPNRTLLLDRLEQALRRRMRSGAPVGAMFCDLDRFKVVNDSLGHGIGDELLKAVAVRLIDAVDPGDTVARFGGDEFVLLIEDPERVERIDAVARTVVERLQAPFSIEGGQEVFLTASVGVAVANDRTTPDSWLADADAAMYRAKESGRNQVELFDADMRRAAVARLQIENDLPRAVERNELVVHYQPVIDLSNGRIIGAEALVRWDHPTRGPLGPDAFIHIAEEVGMVDPVGRHVLDRAVHDLADISGRLGLGWFQLGVNLSARQLTMAGIVESIEQTARRWGWPLDQLLLEITETALTHGVQEPVAVLERIRDLGVVLAIDDFGTGHSSLTRLGRVPAGQVKIDRSFVSAIGAEPADQRVVRMVEAVVAVAGALDLRTSAEGVETEAQLNHLRRIGCSMAQGFLFSEPVPAPELEDLLRTDPRW